MRFRQVIVKKQEKRTYEMKMANKMTMAKIMGSKSARIFCLMF